MRTAPKLVAALAGMTLILLSACSSDSSSSSSSAGTSSTSSTAGSTAMGGTTVAVGLTDYAISVSPATGPAGELTFEISNTATQEHEMVILKTDLSPEALPTKDDGTLDEEGAGVEPIDEVEGVQAATTETLTVDLESGSYVLVCNIYNDKTGEAHYPLGMRASFTVT